MNIKEIKELIAAVCDSGITELELERTGTKVRIRKEPSSTNPDPFGPVLSSITQTSQQPPETASFETPEARSGDSPVPGESDLHFIRSPIVGTFYRAPKPDDEPFVKIGDRVDPKKVLCIIEAMKLMNEIEADTSGQITEIYVENGEAVEFGQTLFGVRQDHES